VFRKLIKHIIFKVVYPLCYRVATIKPVKKNKIVLVENHQATLSEDFRYVVKECKNQGYRIKKHYLRVADSSWSSIIGRSLRLLWDIGDAKCIFISESNSLFGAFTLREGTKLIQLWHACGAFKKWGFSLNDKSFGDSEDELRKYNGHKNYSLVPVSGEEVCWAYEEAFGISGDSQIVKAMGVSRTDIFFDKEKKNKANKKFQTFLQRNHLAEDKKVMLYMPTFRGSIKEAHTPEVFDITAFFKRFQDEYILLIKEHPFVKEKYPVPEQYANQCVVMDQELSTFELMMVSDCMITDYSSVLFEYSLLEKPMIFYAFDMEDYYDERGFYYEYESFVPGQIARDMDELIGCITQISDSDSTVVHEFAKRFMSGCDGKATKRLMDYVKQG